jgi:hypothetical protein
MIHHREKPIPAARAARGGVTTGTGTVTSITHTAEVGDAGRAMTLTLPPTEILAVRMCFGDETGLFQTFCKSELH